MTYTYTAGTLIGAMVEMYKLDKNMTHLDLGHNLTMSVMERMTQEGVLMEQCDHDHSCNLDANIFKGIFVRNLRHLMDVTKNQNRLSTYKQFLTTNIDSLTQHSMCSLHKNHTCHIVYLDGPPAYAAAG